MNRLNIFFDQNTSPRIARALNGYIEADGDRAVHLADMFSRTITDVEWMNALAATGEFWIVITADKRIRKNSAEREAFRQSKLLCLVMSRSWSKTPVNQRAAMILWRWPDIQQVAKFVGTGMFELPLRRSKKLTPLPL